MNSLFVIHPYKYRGSWVFDDAAVGLDREPFVAGADDIIERLTSGIQGAENGFSLVFSAEPFPGHQTVLEWRREEHGGNWYYCPDLDMEGWLCPALLKYFERAPRTIYAQFTAQRSQPARIVQQALDIFPGHIEDQVLEFSQDRAQVAVRGPKGRLHCIECAGAL